MLKFNLVLMLVLLFMSVHLTSNQAATTYYVASGQVYGNATNVPAAGVDNRNTNVNNSGYARGTIQYPFKTIQYAAKQVYAGDTVIVRDGVYYENVYLGLDVGGTAITSRPGTGTARIVLKAEHNGLAYVKGNVAYAGCFEVKSYNDQVDQGWANISPVMAYIDIVGFDLQSTDPLGVGVNLIWAHDVSVRDCTVHDSGGAGIISIYCDYLYISGNQVSNCCRSSSYNASAISVFKVRPWNTYTAPGAYHNSVIRNTCFNNYIYDTSFTHTDGNGIIIDTSRLNISTLVQNNVSYNNGGRGIIIDGCANVDVLNNTSYHNNIDSGVGGSEEIYLNKVTWDLPAENADCSNINVKDNICVPWNGMHCINIASGSTNVNVTNNWLYSASGSTLFTIPSPIPTGWTITNNYGNTEPGVNQAGGDPWFVNPGSLSTSDFHLLSYSPCRDKSGSHPQYDRDYYARPWNNWYDLGAYEYHP